MIGTIRKHFAYYRPTLAFELTYRLNFFFGRVRSIMVFLALAWLWTNVYSGRTVGDYDAASIFTYVLVASLLVDFLISQQNNATIADYIADGGLNGFLVRPASFFWTEFAIVLAAPTLILFTVPLQVVLFLLIFPDISLALPSDVLVWGQFLLSVLFAFFISFLIDFLNGCSAFWLHRAYGFRWMISIFTLIGSGAYLPITLLPDWAEKALSFTPFPSLVYGPVRVLLGGEEIETKVIILTQLFWIAALGLMARVVWKRGIKRYEAVGI